jgi:sec-independent protein translocase protein TatA
MHAEANLLGPDILIILGVVVLLFGGSKIPELAKGLGQGIRSFKDAVNEEPKPDPKAEPKADPPAAKPAEPAA